MQTNIQTRSASLEGARTAQLAGVQCGLAAAAPASGAAWHPERPTQFIVSPPTSLPRAIALLARRTNCWTPGSLVLLTKMPPGDTALALPQPYDCGGLWILLDLASPTYCSFRHGGSNVLRCPEMTYRQTNKMELPQTCACQGAQAEVPVSTPEAPEAPPPAGHTTAPTPRCGDMLLRLDTR